MNNQKIMLTAQDIADMLEISTNKAYQIIRQLNSELAEQGYYTIQGKLNTCYFMERMGLEPDENKKSVATN